MGDSGTLIDHEDMIQGSGEASKGALSGLVLQENPRGEGAPEYLYSSLLSPWLGAASGGVSSPAFLGHVMHGHRTGSGKLALRLRDAGASSWKPTGTCLKGLIGMER